MRIADGDTLAAYFGSSWWSVIWPGIALLTGLAAGSIWCWWHKSMFDRTQEAPGSVGLEGCSRASW